MLVANVLTPVIAMDTEATSALTTQEILASIGPIQKCKLGIIKNKFTRDLRLFLGPQLH